METRHTGPTSPLSSSSFFLFLSFPGSSVVYLASSSWGSMFPILWITLGCSTGACRSSRASRSATACTSESSLLSTAHLADGRSRASPSVNFRLRPPSPALLDEPAPLPPKLLLLPAASSPPALLPSVAALAAILAAIRSATLRTAAGGGALADAVGGGPGGRGAAAETGGGGGGGGAPAEAPCSPCWLAI